ncbi:MAG: hypothetical protein LQ345_004589 [Seirophora villosa]|nr:MAG: hypothetical protein LQ345_004589 [Seirophora villosa]
MSNPLLERLESFQKNDEERQAFFRALIDAYSHLERELTIAKSDHLDQLNSRRMWQDKAQVAEGRLKESQDSAFNESLIVQGAAGGGEAANRVLDNVRRHIQQYDGTHWKIIVRIYANLEGLLKKYAYIGFTEEERTLRQFVTGFTQSQPLFDFVDAGQGKERADHKIKEHLGLFLSNVQCKHVMLGVAHDNGYVPALDPYKSSPATASRISLLRPIRTGWEFQGLPFEFVDFDSFIFRTEELPNDRPSYANLAKTNSSFRPPIPLPTPSNQKPVKAVKDLVMRRPLYPGPIYLNKDEERVDEPLGTVSAKAEARLEARIQHSGKLCNEFNLRGDCLNPRCPYAHEPALDGEELIVFALKARQTACGTGSRCRFRLCVLGHQCPNQRSGGSACPRAHTCYFKKLHQVDPQIDHEHGEF